MKMILQETVSLDNKYFWQRQFLWEKNTMDSDSIFGLNTIYKDSIFDSNLYWQIPCS